MDEVRRLCPVCRGSMRIERRPWMFRCVGCGLLASDLTPDIPATVDTSPISEEARRRGLATPRSRNNRIILDKVEAACGPKRRLLDVGCGHGDLMEEAARRGFAVEGIEPDANVAPRARARTGLFVRQGYFPDALAEAERYDVIVFNDVLEHIPTIGAAVAASERHLEPGGILVLNSPDQDGIFYRIATLLDRLGVASPLERLWQVGLPSPHLWYFKPTHLSALGAAAGLSPLEGFALFPITRDGLRDRIFYVKDQSRVMSWASYAFAFLFLDVLKALPPDLGVVLLKKD